MTMNNSQSYDAVAKFLHWLIGLALLFMIALGWYMNSIPRGDPSKFQLFQLHKSVGITILLLAIFRLMWRLTHRRPPLVPMPKWEVVSAKLVVVLFYVLMIGVPFLGWVIVSASPLNIPTKLFGAIPWPHLPILPSLDNRQDIQEVAETLHVYLAYSILGVLVLHAGAALRHHFIKHDETLLRMLPRFCSHRFNQKREN